MSHLRLTVMAAALICAAALPAGAQGATLPRTYVSSTGSDVNDCTRADPCHTFSGAMFVTDYGGEITALDEGPYGPISIDRPITIDGAGARILVDSPTGGPAYGIRIDAGNGERVVLRGLHLNGARAGADADGIYVERAGSIRIDDVRISGFSRAGIFAAPKHTPSRLSLTDSLITHNGRSGVVVRTPAAGAPNTTARATLRDNVIAANGGHGVYALSTGPPRAVINAYDNLIIDNDLDGVRAEGSLARAHISLNDISGNLGQGLRAVAGAQLLSFGNNRVVDNGIDGVPTGTLGPK